jgi:hypothetical protein
VYGDDNNGPEFVKLDTKAVVHNIVQQLLEVMNEAHTALENVVEEDEEDEIIFPPAPNRALQYLSMVLEITQQSPDIHHEVLEELRKFAVDEKAHVSAKINVLKLVKVEEKQDQQQEVLLT